MMSVFCVTFDQSGRYVLTVSFAIFPLNIQFQGGDDKIIKVWDTVYGRLRYTFRGHVGEVTDMSINAENNCLASGSNDKTVRYPPITFQFDRWLNLEFGTLATVSN